MPKRSIAVWSVVILVLAATSYGFFRYSKKDNVNITRMPEALPSKFVYKNGTYLAEGHYFSPGGEEKILLHVTLKDDIIIGAVVEANTPATPTSTRYQAIFVANFKQYVVGKKINEVNLDKVSGSSLTPMGFNDALDKIKTQAKA